MNVLLWLTRSKDIIADISPRCLVHSCLEEFQTMHHNVIHTTNFKKAIIMIVHHDDLFAVDLFLEQIGGCLEDGAVLVSIRPLKISGKEVANDFIQFEPSKYK